MVAREYDESGTHPALADMITNPGVIPRPRRAWLVEQTGPHRTIVLDVQYAPSTPSGFPASFGNMAGTCSSMAEIRLSWDVAADTMIG
jgi:hypothetical protein